MKIISNFYMNLIFTVFVTITLSQAAEGEIKESDHNRSSLIKKYIPLFLTPFDSLVLEGKVDEARKYANSFLIQQKYKTDYTTHNWALDDRLVDRYQSLRSLENSERLQPFNFRTLSIYKDKAIQNCKNNQSALRNEMSSRSESIELLKKQKESGSSAYKSIQNDAEEILEDFISKLERAERFKLPESLNYFELSEVLTSYVALLKKIQERIARKEKIDLEEAREIIERIRKKLLELGGQNPNDKLYTQVSNCLLEDTNPAKFSMIRSCKVYHYSLSVSEEETLTFDGREQLDNFSSFIEDTNSQIEKEETKIAFIQEHPWLFTILKRDRLELLGALDLPSNMYLGRGIAVGVIDNFLFYDLTNIQRSSLDHKADLSHILITDGLTSKEREEQQGRINDNHGVHVGSIIASGLISNRDSTRLGVAPEANLVFFDQHLVDNSNSGIIYTSDTSHTDTKDDLSVNFHLNILNRLMKEEQGSVTCQVKPFNVTYAWDKYEARKNNIFCKTPITLFNLSRDTSAIGKNGKIGTNKLEQFGLMWTVALRPDALYVLAMGNDQVDISTSSTLGRSKRALAQCPATQQCVLFVTNLMEDGMSLKDSANVPGNNIHLQQRTLSAVGTNVESAYRFDKYEKYGEIVTGSSFSAPQVTGAAAVVLSNFTHFTTHMAGDCLLKGATPLLYDEDSLYVYELKAFTAESLTSSLDVYSEGITIPKDQFIQSFSIASPDYITVTKTWWNKSQGLFGQGRVNIKQALDVAKKLTNLQ